MSLPLPLALLPEVLLADLEFEPEAVVDAELLSSLFVAVAEPDEVFVTERVVGCGADARKLLVFAPLTTKPPR